MKKTTIGSATTKVMQPVSIETYIFENGGSKELAFDIIRNEYIVLLNGDEIYYFSKYKLADAVECYNKLIPEARQDVCDNIAKKASNEFYNHLSDELYEMPTHVKDGFCNGVKMFAKHILENGYMEPGYMVELIKQL